jgi:hypothetical protein
MVSLNSDFCVSAPPAVLNMMWPPAKIKLDEEKWKHVVLAQQNGLDPAFFRHEAEYVSLVVVSCWLKEWYLPSREPNKYMGVINRMRLLLLLLLPVSSNWRTIMIGPGGLLLVVSHLICSPSLANNNDWSRWFAISSLPRNLQSQFWIWRVELRKRKRK